MWQSESEISFHFHYVYIELSVPVARLSQFKTDLKRTRIAGTDLVAQTHTGYGLLLQLYSMG